MLHKIYGLAKGSCEVKVVMIPGIWKDYGSAMNHRLGRQDRSICIYECYGIYVDEI
jgi:hypothetical protein